MSSLAHFSSRVPVPRSPAAHRPHISRSRARPKPQVGGKNGPQDNCKKEFEYAERTNDWQQVIESREMESGRQKILLEPPSSDATDPEGNALWKYAPPHVTSHWDTISRVNKDPPPRTHVKTIAAYRKYFPSVENRPPTPRHPVWGGNREQLYSREATMSPRSGRQSRESAREALLSPAR